MAVDDTDDRWPSEGVGLDGDRIRPGEWIGRISATLATFGEEHRLSYDREVHPCIIRGQKCLVVGRGLSQRKPQLLAYLLKFAADNQLRIQEERRSLDLPSSIERRVL